MLSDSTHSEYLFCGSQKTFLKSSPTLDFSVNSKKVSDLFMDDKSTLDPTNTSESSVMSSTMSDEMDWPILDEWNISDLEPEPRI